MERRVFMSSYSSTFKEEFLEILRTGIVNKEMKSKYACNFRFFQNNIDEFLSKYPTYFAYLPTQFRKIESGRFEGLALIRV